MVGRLKRICRSGRECFALLVVVSCLSGIFQSAQAQFGAGVRHDKAFRPIRLTANSQRDVRLPPLPVQMTAENEGDGAHTSAIIRQRLAEQRRRLRKAKNGKVMQIVVSLGRQKMTVYEDGQAVKKSPVSSGKAGHNTPKGIFSIIQKRRFHRSNIYSGAPMPYMQRMTWSGIAFHQGRLPGYAASHGCIRLPGRFARNFFKLSQMRTHVVIADGNPRPYAISHPNLFGLSDVSQQQLPVLGAPTMRLVTGALATPQAVRHRLKVRYEKNGVAAPPASEKIPVGDDDDVNELTAMLHFDQTDQLAHRYRVRRVMRSSPLRVLVTRRTQRDRTRDLQRGLVALGYEVGGIDGLIGRQMIAATKAFQSANNLQASGLPNEATRDLINLRSGRPPAAIAEVYVRQNGRQIYSGPVELEKAAEPLGTHLFTLMDLGDEPETQEWQATTVQAKGRLPAWSKKDWKKRLAEIKTVSAAEAIGRIKFPTHVRQSIEDRLTPGSSLIIADRGSERETGLATDYIVLTD